MSIRDWCATIGFVGGGILIVSIGFFLMTKPRWLKRQVPFFTLIGIFSLGICSVIHGIYYTYLPLHHGMINGYWVLLEDILIWFMAPLIGIGNLQVTPKTDPDYKKTLRLAVGVITFFWIMGIGLSFLHWDEMSRHSGYIHLGKYGTNEY